MRWSFLLAAILSATLCSAHPAVHVVMDARGSIYYSDNSRVWRIDPQGGKSVAVPDVHTHELWIDSFGNLYGEHLSYAGGIWSHRVWKRTPDGRIADAIPTRKGFLTGYKDFSLQRDARGGMYWCSASGRIQYRASVDAPLQTIANLNIRQPGWTSVLPDGTVLVSDRGSLVRLSPDRKSRTVIRASKGKDPHSVMTAWAGPGGAVLWADWDGASVKRIEPSGAVATVAVSPAPWRPAGGLAAPDGSLWILEASPTNEQRLRRVSAGGESRVY